MHWVHLNPPSVQEEFFRRTMYLFILDLIAKGTFGGNSENFPEGIPWKYSIRILFKNLVTNPETKNLRRSSWNNRRGFFLEIFGKMPEGILAAILGEISDYNLIEIPQKSKENFIKSRWKIAHKIERIFSRNFECNPWINCPGAFFGFSEWVLRELFIESLGRLLEGVLKVNSEKKIIRWTADGISGGTASVISRGTPREIFLWTLQKYLNVCRE